MCFSQNEFSKRNRKLFLRGRMHRIKRDVVTSCLVVAQIDQDPSNLSVASAKEERPAGGLSNDKLAISIFHAVQDAN